jgi:hypothetical protein
MLLVSFLHHSVCVAHCSGYYSAFKICFANVLCDTLPDANSEFV